MKKGFVIVSILAALLISGICANAKSLAKEEVYKTAWKLGFLIPSENNFSSTLIAGFQYQTDIGKSYAGAIDFDMSNSTSCDDETPGAVVSRCRVKHRVATASVKRKINFGPGNPTMLLGAGVAYMMSDLNLNETYLGTAFAYHNSGNKFGTVLSLDVDGLFDERPEIFFQARFIDAGKQSAPVARMENKLGGWTFTTGYRFNF